VNIHYKAFSVREDWVYVSERAMPKLVEDTCGIIAVDLDTGQRVAAAIFDHILEGSAQVHIMIDKPTVLRHGFLEEAADFIFNFMGKEVVFGLTPAGNEKALKFNKRAEFKEVYRVPNGFAVGTDLVMMQLLKEECTYLPYIEEAS
jgi:hypothetical protein